MCPTHAIIENENQNTLNRINIKKHIQYCNFTNKNLKKAILKTHPYLKNLENIDLLIKNYLTDHIEETFIQTNQFALLKFSYQNDDENIYENKFLDFIADNNEYDLLILDLKKSFPKQAFLKFLDTPQPFCRVPP